MEMEVDNTVEVAIEMEGGGRAVERDGGWR